MSANTAPVLSPLNLLTEPMMKEWLKPVLDPDIMVSLVDLGLIYGVALDAENAKVSITMTLTTPACPQGPYLIEELKKRMMEYPGVKECDVSVVWEPKWDPKTMASDECKDMLGIW